jgi:hypothetical protein
MAMTAREPAPATEILTAGEVQDAARRAVAGLGLSIDQLQDQARRGHFSSERARLVWVAIRDVVPAT